ncbi:MAG: hypothetical protein Q8R60_11040 [Mycobacteriales bacterium]|nr:hypothetical protein [Mycobacteriales bacterium]
MFYSRWAFSKALRTAARTPDRDQAATLVYWPPPTDARAAADVVGRICFYLRGSDVPVVVPGVSEVDPAAAPYLDATLVGPGPWQSQGAAGSPLHLLHDVRPRTLPAVARVLRSSLVVDPSLSYTSEFVPYRLLRAVFCAPFVQGPLRDEMLSGHRPGAKAFVMGTGPSAALVDPDAVDADVRILCNSAVRNKELISRLQPTHVVFGDPIFHFGPSRYAAAFRADLREALALAPFTVVVPEHSASLILEHVPELSGRLVGLATAGDWNIPSREEPRVRDSGNILTQFLLPIAFALADSVDVAGCDGRQPTENYFWKHNPGTQYDQQLMNDVFEAHPAFFRYRSYADYYDRHLTQLEQLIRIGEEQGKSVRGTTPSWMPPLASRGAPVPEQ